MPLPGFRDAIRAFGSGGSVEQQGFDDEGRRLTAARSASALMDSRIAKAIQDSQEADSAVALRNSFGPNPDERQLSILSKLAGELLSGNRAEGVAQQNEARGLQLENVKAGGDIDIDLQNFLTQVAGDKLTGKGNFRVGEQIDADIQATEARARASDATAAFNESRIAGVDGTNTAFKDLTSAQIASSFGFTDEGREEFRRFRRWKGIKSRTDKNFRNASFALDEYLIENPQALSTFSVPGSSKDNPVIAVPGEAQPPPGTWSRLPDGRVIQAP